MFSLKTVVRYRWDRFRVPSEPFLFYLPSVCLYPSAVDGNFRFVKCHFRLPLYISSFPLSTNLLATSVCYSTPSPPFPSAFLTFLKQQQQQIDIKWYLFPIFFTFSLTFFTFSPKNGQLLGDFFISVCFFRRKSRMSNMVLCIYVFMVLRKYFSM